MPPLLSVENLTVRLPPSAARRHALRQCSLTLEPGEIRCVVGPSGSGKSTLAGAIMGLLPHGVAVEGGRILYGGRDLVGLPERSFAALRGREIGIVLQEPRSALNPVMRIGDQVAEALEAHARLPARERKARVTALLREVGLIDPARIAAAFPFELSGGQVQRAMIAIATALAPAVLLADEPTSALDVTTQAEILALIRTLLARRRMAIMVITHDLDVAREVADRVSVMHEGHVVEDGTATDVLGRPAHAVTRRLVEAVPAGPIVLAPPGASEPLLRIEGLTKTFVSRRFFGARTVVRAVDGVSLTIGRGEILGLVGRSGSGKSTIGRAIVRLVEPDSGSVRLGEIELTTLTGEALRQVRRRVQMVFQDPEGSLDPRATIARTVARGPIASGTPRSEAFADARRLLSLVGLDASAGRRYPLAFSGGERQRIAIARALALRPELIVADEPVSSLDAFAQAQILDLLRFLRDRFALSLLFITHDLRAAARLCDRVAVMHEGRIVEVGPVADVFLAPRAEETVRLLAALPGARWRDGTTAAR